jgi:hypothetical protein
VLFFPLFQADCYPPHCYRRGSQPAPAVKQCPGRALAVRDGLEEAQRPRAHVPR